MRRLIFVSLLAALLACIAPSLHAAAGSDVPSVAAAADLQFALTDIATAFAKDTGRDVKLVFGSSGNFRRQIAAGAPFEVFLSADEAYVQSLAREGRTRDEGVIYAVGRIALVAATGSPLALDGQLKGLRAALGKARIHRFAIANPEHAPYGRAAKQALEHAGLWTALQGRLVLGENVAQAAQFALTPTVQGGIISFAQARSATLEKRLAYALIPDDWHAPLRQRMVLLKNAGPTAAAFYAYLLSPKARGVLTRYGFAVPVQ
ncbi:MAG: molybdate ABC transporter substrate-binding protein [Casimicrobiaceae bacterium]